MLAQRIALKVAMTLMTGLAQISSGLAAEPTLAQQGQLLLEKNCSRCHAIGRAGTSPVAEAPPFRTVVSRYPPENLAEALAEGIMTRHSEMPQFVFAPDEIDAIIAYLDTLGAENAN